MATRPKAVIESRNGEKFSPITITKNVLTDDGQNLHDILSDRKEDMMTPTIENSSSMFKIGQGNNVDYSSNVVNGAYESLVFKGKSLVNLLTKTIDTTWNLNLENWSIVTTASSDYVLKPSTTYSVIVYVTEKTCRDREDLFWVGDVDGKKNKVTHDIVRKNVSLGANVFVINTVSDFSSVTSEHRGGIYFQGSKFVEGTLKWKAIVLEGDWTNKELPPYFEGICDCKSPILTNVGKNLFNFSDLTMKSSWWINVENGITNVKKEDLSTNYSVIIPAQSNVQYKVSGNNITRAFYAFLDKDYNVLHANEMVERTTKSLSPQGTAYALFYLNHEDIEKVTNLQIEEGSTATPYEPYKSNTTTFKQKDGKMIVLRSLPNGVCDTLNVETGEYVQRIGELVVNGDDTITYNGISTTANNTVRLVINHPSIQNNPIETVVCAYCDRSKYQYNYQDTADIEGFFVAKSNNRIFMRLEKRKLETLNVAGIKKYLSKTPYTFQYELIEPIVTTIDIQGFPYAYTNGHVQLSSDSIEQSLTPKVEYSVVTNRNGQIRSNQKMVERHQKQLDRLQAMILTNLVNTQYEQTLTNLKYDLKNVREEVK